MSVISFAHIFSCSEGCLFILFVVSFAVPKLLVRSHLFIFVFISITLYSRRCDPDNFSLAFALAEINIATLAFF